MFFIGLLFNSFGVAFVTNAELGGFSYCGHSIQSVYDHASAGTWKLSDCL